MTAAAATVCFLVPHLLKSQQLQQELGSDYTGSALHHLQERAGLDGKAIGGLPTYLFFPQPSHPKLGIQQPERKEGGSGPRTQPLGISMVRWLGSIPGQQHTHTNEWSQPSASRRQFPGSHSHTHTASPNCPYRNGLGEVSSVCLARISPSPDRMTTFSCRIQETTQLPARLSLGWF